MIVCTLHYLHVHEHIQCIRNLIVVWFSTWLVWSGILYLCSISLTNNPCQIITIILSSPFFFKISHCALAVWPRIFFLFGNFLKIMPYTSILCTLSSSMFVYTPSEENSLDCCTMISLTENCIRSVVGFLTCYLGYQVTW